MAWCGLRWREVAGLKVGRVAFLRCRLTVDGVTTQLGKWKEYPKTSKSRREIPVEPQVLELVAPRAEAKRPDELLLRTVRGERPWSGANWRVRWYQAIDDARAAQPELEIPAHSPHMLRHIAASWLVRAGVPLYDVQKLLGHESFAVTARYAHLAPDAHDAVEAAWRRLLEQHDQGDDETGAGGGAR